MTDPIAGRIEFSPQPWRIEQTHTNNWIGPGSPDGKVDRVVCSIDREGLTPDALARNDANARLIAAAPDLYAAIKDSMEYLEMVFAPCDPGCGCVLHRLRAAVAKAEGRDA